MNIKEMDKNIEARIIKTIDSKLTKSSKTIEKFIKERFEYYINKRVEEQFKSIKPKQIDKWHKQALDMNEALEIVKQKRISNNDKGAK